MIRMSQMPDADHIATPCHIASSRTAMGVLTSTRTLQIIMGGAQTYAHRSARQSAVGRALFKVAYQDTEPQTEISRRRPTHPSLKMAYPSTTFTISLLLLAGFVAVMAAPPGSWDTKANHVYTGNSIQLYPM